MRSASDEEKQSLDVDRVRGVVVTRPADLPGCRVRG